MISVIVGTILAALIGVVSFMFYAFNKRIAGVASATVAVIVFLAGVALYPYSSVWHDSIKSRAMIEQAQNEAKAIEILSNALGGSEAYLEYIKIKGQD